MSSKTVDARGLSCPQPVLLALDAMKIAEINELTILVDTDTSKENVSRAAASQNWQLATIEEEDGGYQLHLKRS